CTRFVLLSISRRHARSTLFPYTTLFRSQGGASVPGFDALTVGRAQLFSFGATKAFGSNTVNEFHFSITRNTNDVGRPHGGTGVRSEEHTSELQSLRHLVCRLLLEKKK